MRVTVLLFASLRDLVGTRQHTLDLPPFATVQMARQALIDQYPAAADNLRVALAAVNQEFAPPHTPPQGWR